MSFSASIEIVMYLNYLFIELVQCFQSINLQIISHQYFTFLYLLNTVVMTQNIQIENY